MFRVETFKYFADYVTDRYKAELGSITMNTPMLLDALEAVGVENLIICSNINKLGFRMSGGLDSYEKILRERNFRAIAMSVFASGAINPDVAIQWVCSLPNIHSIVFGASSRWNIQKTKQLVDKYWRA